MNAQSKGLIALEQEVMNALLQGDDSVLKALRAQYRQSIVVGRETTGHGFFTDFAVESDEYRISDHVKFDLGDVTAEVDGLEHGAGFILFVEDGKLKMLEGYSYEEAWPNDIGKFRVDYLGGEERDLVAVRKAWSDC